MVKANVVVGLVGLVIAAVAGAVIVANWDSLADIHTYEVQVESDSDGRHLAGATPAGDTDRVVVWVRQPNVTSLSGSFVWQDRTPQDEAAHVTLTITDPAGDEVFSQARRGGGAQGFSFNVAYVDEVPAPTLYRETEATAQTRFAADYPELEEGTGNWTFTITVEPYGGSLPLGAGDVAWDLDLSWTHYSARLVQVEDIDFRGK